ncbi:hypothetical protein JTB14_029264 [Gonioctena quinquepunctata]|nr:hypothetical protein JTB14_029264 [Gonioctena quinquepunctata]
MNEICGYLKRRYYYLANIANTLGVSVLNIDIRSKRQFQLQVCTLVMIMSCDMVEKSALKLLNTCNYLRATAGNNVASEELSRLSDFIEELSPEFTAAGFFRINRRLIPAFLSSLTSYIIILIQFKMA